MVLKRWYLPYECETQFENDVKMYGTETESTDLINGNSFENDVKMYGTETKIDAEELILLFENDVKMYGTET